MHTKIDTASKEAQAADLLTSAARLVDCNHGGPEPVGIPFVTMHLTREATRDVCYDCGALRPSETGRWERPSLLNALAVRVDMARAAAAAVKS